MSGRYRGPSCPVDPEHGALLDLPSGRWGWFCPHRGHEPHKGVERTRAFFTTEEVEAQKLNAIPSIVADAPKRRGRPRKVR